MIINTFKRGIAVLLVFSCVFTVAIAQDDLEIITFDDDSRSSSSKDYVGTQLVIKSNPLSFLYGRQFVEGEYALTDYLTLEGGIGVTFLPRLSGTQNIYAEAYREIFLQEECSSPNYEGSLDFCDQNLYDDYSIRKASVGPWLTGALKFYLFNDALDGSYISLNLKYHRNNYQVLTVEETLNFQRTDSDYVNEYVSNLDYTVRAGLQTIFDPLVTDAFVGIGIRSINQNRLDIGIDPGMDAYTNSFHQSSSSGLVIEVGIRLGIGISKKAPAKSKKKKKKRRR